MSAREKIVVSKGNAQALNMSIGLLDMIKEGEVTHPNIARRIGLYFGLSDEETEELMPEIHRPSSPNYEPDKFVATVDRNISLSAQREPTDPYDIYVSERNKRDLA